MGDDEKWLRCNLAVNHDGQHRQRFGYATLHGCGLRFRNVVEDGVVVSQVTEHRAARPTLHEEPPHLRWDGDFGKMTPWQEETVKKFSEKESIFPSIVTDPGKPFDPSVYTSEPRHHPDGRPVLTPNLDMNAPLFEQARQASAALAEMGVDAEQALAIIMVQIATAENVREESSKWLTKFTEQIIALVDEAEADGS